ncbi:hypothetical protein LTR85_001539 [Meristemomyces frigidus]|nr:hypothetical protein LTR85_001539 [Meristemomyces frigidus]
MRPATSLTGLTAIACWVAQTLTRSVGDPQGWEDGSDLEHFVTRPDLTAPRYMVAKHHPEAIGDGYWFVAPYSSLYDQPGFNGRREHVTGQTGPHIYDGDGNLVWSGASRYYNRDVFAFHPVHINATHQLTFHLAAGEATDGLPGHSAQVFLDSSYEQVGRVDANARGDPIDFHVFNVLPGGQRALVNYDFWAEGKATYPGGDGQERPILNAGFEETDLQTGEAVYAWDAYEAGVELAESYDALNRDLVAGIGDYWDYIHLNSLDKDSDGDYYVSARHTSTVYKVSWLDKRIIWRLGGHNSSFSMADGVGFHWQHHVRVRAHNATHTMLSIFDNASEDQSRNPAIAESPSVAKVILLDTVYMTATLLRNHTRPDRGYSRKLGSVQQIGYDVASSSLFVDWAQQGYISEYDSDDRLVLEAKFVSDRMSSYRAFKLPWVGKPTSKPQCKILSTAFSDSVDSSQLASTFYISWNGATEVATWTFYRSESSSGPPEKLGTVVKTGFETSWVTPGVVLDGYPEAHDREGNLLGVSDTASLLPFANGVFQQLSQTPSTLSTSIGAGPLFKQPAEGESKSGGEKPVLSRWSQKLTISVAFGAIYALAVFGLYALVQRLAPLSSRWRKGYKLLPVSPASEHEDHLLETSGRQSATFGLVDRRGAT